VLDFEPSSGRTSTQGVERILEHLAAHGLALDWILETHAHADHLSAAALLRERTGARIAIGAGITSVQRHFAGVFNLVGAFTPDGSQFDRLWRDGERFTIGDLAVEVLALPGHTKDSVGYRIADAVFVGDTLFMPDYGTARADFPGGDAGELYDSIQKLYALPPPTRLFMCHDYPPQGRAPRAETTVGEERRSNIHLGATTTREAFIALRKARDATLAVPKLLIPSIQVNIRAGATPPPEANGIAYLKVPLNLLGR
jgi:glyoxylase-like metal-dependent hydrolase (beta-lactamase superfamily II)